MIAPQSPSLQVFVPVECVSRADMASQCLAAIAAIHADDIIVVHRSPYRYGRCENFLFSNGLPEVTQRVMDCGDQVRKLLWSQRVVPHIAPDDCCREMWIDLFSVHDLLSQNYFPQGSYTPDHQMLNGKKGSQRRYFL